MCYTTSFRCVSETRIRTADSIDYLIKVVRYALDLSVINTKIVSFSKKTVSSDAFGFNRMARFVSVQ